VQQLARRPSDNRKRWFHICVVYLTMLLISTIYLSNDRMNGNWKGFRSERLGPNRSKKGKVVKGKKVKFSPLQALEALRVVRG
jgi:hypothetical protein